MSEKNNDKKTNTSEKLISLINEFGSMSDVPNEKLKELGYIRNEDGSITRKDVIEERKRDREKYLKKMEKKKEMRPFGLIEMELKQKDIQGRRLGEYELIEISECLSDFEEDVVEQFDTSISIPQNNPYWTFKKQFEEYIKELNLNSEEKLSIKRIISTLGGGIIYSASEPILKFSEKFEELLERNHEEEEFLSSKNSELLIKDLERNKGSLTDEDFYKKEFEKAINENWIEAIDNKNPSIELVQIHKENGTGSYEEFITFYIKDFIKKTNYPEIHQKIEKCKNFSDLISTIENLSPEDFPSFNKLKTIKKSLKQASLEEKKSLGKDKKYLSEQLKHEKRLLNGIVECLSQYKFFGPFFKKIIDKLQDSLTIHEGDIVDEKFYLDGTPDLLLDENPGKISGDCTENKPLPFNDPNVPIYNIKVLEKNKEHIGNIYLFETKEIESKRKCWHLDAIQIPSTIDWDNEIENIIETIGRLAKEKKVKLVTVNNEPSKISNYDYIQKAIISYNQKNNLGETGIYTMYETSVNKEYSDLQGDGDVLIIWENDQKEEVSEET